MTVLLDHQFEILPTEGAASGFVFGHGTEVPTVGEGFDPGETDWTSQDTDNTRSGIKNFGRDVQVPKQWVWESFADRDDLMEAVDTIERFSNAWILDELVLEPGAQTVVRYGLAGRTRRVYGRPRRYAAPPTNMILSGTVDITHDFQCVDAYTYDDEQSQEQILFSSTAAAGGMVLPVIMPSATNPGTADGGGSFFVGGSARTYPVIRFNGPWVDPGFSTPTWSLQWNGTIGVGEWVEIDTRPWKRTVLNNSGGAVAGNLVRGTFLEDCWLAAQTLVEVTLFGEPTGGSSNAVVSWRNAHRSI